MLDLESPEIQFAIQTTHRAVQLVRQVQTELVTPALTKEDRSPVTVADFACQALVAYLLSDTFPNDPLVAEEDSGALREPDAANCLENVTHFFKKTFATGSPGRASSDLHVLSQVNSQQICNWIDRGRAQKATRFWTLDPIDGTKGFLRGDQYAVALALIHNGEVQIGALGCPYLVNANTPDLTGAGSLVIAARGQGTWSASLDTLAEWRRLHVSSRSNPSDACLLRSFESGHTNVDQIDLFAQAMGIQVAPVLMDSQAKYALLASGKGDLLLRLLSASKPDYREKIWDQAAGSLVLEESGGQITDLDGKPLDFTTGRALTHNRGILASNGTLHAPALKALKQIGA